MREKSVSWRLTISLLILLMLMLLTLTGCGTSQQDNSKDKETQESASAEAGTDNNEVEDAETGTDAETDAKTDTTEQDSASSGEQDTQESGDATMESSDILVVYFSRTGEQYTVGVIDEGNTAIVAKMIADETGADMFEILPKEDYYPYTYDELTDIAKQEQNENARPEYAGEAPDLSKYSTIFIGAPVWWGDWPMIMYTFFENNEEALAGKVLIPFSTHEGSGLSGFDNKLASACPASEVLDGLAIRGNEAQNNQDSVRSTVNDWLAGLGY